MHRLLTSVSALSLALLAQGAVAQDQGLRYSGNIEGEYSSTGGSDLSVLGGDLDLGYSFGSVGVEFGIDSDYFVDDEVDFTAFSAAVTFDSPFGQVALGAPRPVNDILITLPQFAGNRVLDLELSFIGAGVTTPLIKSFGEFGYGARLMGDNGALRYGVSLHQPADLSEVITVQGAAQYSTGALRFEGALEQAFISGGNDGLNATAGVAYDANPLSGGLYLGRADALLSAETIRGFAGYAVSDRLSVRGDVMWVSGEVDTTLFGAEARYGFGNGSYAQFGVLDGTSGQDTTLDATLGFSF